MQQVKTFNHQMQETVDFLDSYPRNMKPFIPGKRNH